MTAKCFTTMVSRLFVFFLRYCCALSTDVFEGQQQQEVTDSLLRETILTSKEPFEGEKLSYSQH